MIKGVDSITGDFIYDSKGIIEDSIKNIISTELGSSVMDRSGGSRFTEFIGLPMDEFTLHFIKMEFSRAIRIGETRINFSKIEINNKLMSKRMIFWFFLNT